MKAALRWWPKLPANDLLRDRAYRRLWTSIAISSFGGQVTMLALPLTAAVLLHATPTQMGLLGAVEILPFVLFCCLRASGSTASESSRSTSPAS